MPRYLPAGALGLAMVVSMAGPAVAVPTTTLADGLTADDLAQTLAGTGVTINNVTYSGSAVSAGSFTGGVAAIGFEQGVVLSSGDAAVGDTNTSDTYTGATGASGSGDADLDALGAGPTTDSTVLEFDVTPDASTLYFNYVFASDEYTEYVGSQFNDVFGFFVTQAGTTTKQNCAVIADGSDADTAPDPVTVNTINGTTNPTLYRNNDLSDGGATIPAEPDGFTTVLQCVATVVPNQANHLKLAISDVGDSSFDSWVFLQAESISTESEVCGDGIDNDGDGQVDEGCVVNQPPTVSAGGPYSGDEGASVALTGTASDPDAGDAVSISWTYTAGSDVDSGATCTFADPSAVSTTVSCTDDGTYTLTLTGNDGTADPVTSDATLTVHNVSPATTVTSPADLSVHQVGANVSVSATFGDPGENDTHTCTIDWGDGSAPTAGTLASGTCSGVHAYDTIGVYTVTVTVTDDDGGTGSDEVVLVVEDNRTKVTGGGFVLDDGRYSFGFVAKHGDSGPEGQMQVRTHANKHRFHGDEITALTSTGNTATWAGSGRYDGVSGYTFEVSVADNGTGKKKGTADTITVTVRDAAGTEVLHFTGPLQGGNIKVH